MTLFNSVTFHPDRVAEQENSYCEQKHSAINFNPQPSTYLHLDLNSCFATIEQQANPLLRGKPIAVAAYTTPRGCILAPSVEAKRLGIKVGMRVMEGTGICPDLIVLPPDPDKYRFVNQVLFNLLNKYTPDINIKSIDEMLLNFSAVMAETEQSYSLINIAREIKTRIKSQIGEYLTVSIGISTNPYLAKLAAGLHKPDGLDEINQHNVLDILSRLQLVELPYIKYANALRLTNQGIKTPVGFYFAGLQKLKAAFTSINGYYWHLRLHGYEIDNVTTSRKTIGHSYALPKPTENIKELLKLLCKLIEKTGKRLRNNGFTANGIHLALYFNDQTFWHHGHKTYRTMYTNQDLFLAAKNLLTRVPHLKQVSNIFITCFNLEKDLYSQLTFFENEIKKRNLTQALDKINDKWGDFSIYPASMINMSDKIIDRIAFGKTWDNRPLAVNEETGWERIKYG